MSAQTQERRRRNKAGIKTLTRYQLRRDRDRKLVELALLKKIAKETGTPLSVLLKSLDN